MPNVFVSCRHEDLVHLGRLITSLAAEFGAGGTHFYTGDDPSRIDEVGYPWNVVASSDVVLVLIGPQWEQGIDDAGDSVLLHIDAALKNGKPIVPVLVGGANSPRSDWLPRDFREAASHQAFRLTETRWEEDVKHLIQRLRQVLRHAGVPRNAEPMRMSMPSGEVPSGPASPPGATPSRNATSSSDALRPAEVDRRDIFISYAEEDSSTASNLAKELRAQRLSTWMYEEDGVPGISHLTQVFDAIETCLALVLIASPRSVKTTNVIREVEAAHERDKMIITIRSGLTHGQFTASSTILRMATGTAVSSSLDGRDPKEIAKRIANALRHASQKAKT